MARRRTTQRRQTSESGNGSTGGGELICPECGKTFSRAASLGAHRRAAHGVAGARAAARKTPSKSSRRARATTTRTTAPTRGSGRSTAEPRTDGVDRDALLSALFPDGIPPRQDLLRSVNEWLDEGERLAQLR
jgi:hypothetical protein